MAPKMPGSPPPLFGAVSRTADDGIVVMWLIEGDNLNGTHQGSVIILKADGPLGSLWGDPGEIEDGISWIYHGWEWVE